jgi:hypothetical protein
MRNDFSNQIPMVGCGADRLSLNDAVHPSPSSGAFGAGALKEQLSFPKTPPEAN